MWCHVVMWSGVCPLCCCHPRWRLTVQSSVQCYLCHHHQSSGTNSDSSSQNSGDDLEDELEDEDLDLIKNNLQLGDDDLGELGISTKVIF